MLENIKSLYILKNVFINIEDEIKLNLVKYNKKLQKKLDISLIDYKFFSNKYIVYEDNGKGTIYNAFNNKILYNGEISNGKKNGRGKEYDTFGNVLFEGEFLNGKRYKKNSEELYELKEGFMS